MLEVNEVSVFYGTYQTLWDLSMLVSDGETVGLFGPNGHGKTTLLKTISGLLSAKSGAIRLDGRVISNLPPQQIVQKGVVHVLQEAHLFSDMMVLENLYLGAYLPHAWSERKRNLEKVFHLFPRLEERKGQRCSTLSGGERQMVAIGRGLMADAKLLMLDEPFLGLAPNLSREILEKILEIKKSGISMIFTEQNMAYAAYVSDRMYLIENGGVSLEGEKDAILESDYVQEAYLGLAKQE